MVPFVYSIATCSPVCSLLGFKSYPVRTTITGKIRSHRLFVWYPTSEIDWLLWNVTGWDPSFNAITGLNGSGKSNILDAICFVLGITNMTQVRGEFRAAPASHTVIRRLLNSPSHIANNLMDLIYKRQVLRLECFNIDSTDWGLPSSTEVRQL